MRKNLNTEHVEGRVYEHKLELKLTGPTSKKPGTPYIAGNLDVATDEAGINIIPVHFTYVTELTSKGKKNDTFAALKTIIEKGKTVLTDGMENATKVKIDTALALNDWYDDQDQLISTKVNEGGFVTIINELTAVESDRNKFKADMLITNVTSVEANPEKNIEAHVSLRGAVFNFKNEILPVDFVVKNPQGMKYFEDLGVTAAEPVYTQVWGRITCETHKSTQTVESGFGEAEVTTRERKVKEWVVTGVSKVPYDFGDDQVMTEDEVRKASQDRQTMLAEVKKRRDEYKAQKAAGALATPGQTAAPSQPVSSGNFGF